MTEYFIGNFATGRRIQSLPVMTGPWNDRLYTAEQVTATVDMNDAEVQGLDLDNSATPGQAFLIVEEGHEEGPQLRGGPIWTSEYDHDNRTMTLGALGAASYYDHRMIIPLLAMTADVSTWTIPDPADATKTIPNPALSTVFNGLSLGTQAKRLVEQSRLFTGGNVPIVFPADELDDRTQTYLGADFKPVWEAINDLMDRENGPEVKFVPRYTANRDGVEWEMRIGTIAQPLLTSTTIPLWDATVKESPILNLRMKKDATKLGSLAWFTGGRQADDVLVSRAYDPTLVQAGFPLLETVDSSHSTVSAQSTLDGYAVRAVRMGRYASSVWSFSLQMYPVDADGFQAGPQFGDYQVGDFCDIYICPSDAETGAGIPLKPGGGTFRMRIIGLSGDEKGDLVKVECAPEVVI